MSSHSAVATTVVPEDHQYIAELTPSDVHQLLCESERMILDIEQLSRTVEAYKVDKVSLADALHTANERIAVISGENERLRTAAATAMRFSMMDDNQTPSTPSQTAPTTSSQTMQQPPPSPAMEDAMRRRSAIVLDIAQLVGTLSTTNLPQLKSQVPMLTSTVTQRLMSLQEVARGQPETTHWIDTVLGLLQRLSWAICHTTASHGHHVPSSSSARASTNSTPTPPPPLVSAPPSPGHNRRHTPPSRLPLRGSIPRTTAALASTSVPLQRTTVASTHPMNAVSAPVARVAPLTDLPLPPQLFRLAQDLPFTQSPPPSQRASPQVPQRSTSATPIYLLDDDDLAVPSVGLQSSAIYDDHTPSLVHRVAPRQLKTRLSPVKRERTTTTTSSTPTLHHTKLQTLSSPSQRPAPHLSLSPLSPNTPPMGKRHRVERRHPQILLDTSQDELVGF